MLVVNEFFLYLCNGSIGDNEIRRKPKSFNRVGKIFILIKMKYLINLVMFIALTIVLFSCEKEETKAIKQDLNETEIADVFVKNGVLVFKDWHVLFTILENFEDKDAQYMDEWEKILGFTSLRTVYDCFTIEELEMVKELEALYNENKDLVTEELVAEKYDKLQKSYENSIVLVEDKENDIKYYSMNLYHTIFAPIVNENGIVSVEGEIYRYTNKDERKIADGDWSKLSELMSDDSPFIKLIEDYSDNSKRVEPFDDMLDPDDPYDPDCTPYSTSYVTSNQWKKNGTDINAGIKKLTVNFRFLQKTYSRRDANCNYTSYTTTKFYYDVFSQKRTAWSFGAWVRCPEYFTVNYTADLYLGSNYSEELRRWETPVYLGLGHTYARTIYSNTTTSNHPWVKNCVLWVETTDDPFGINCSVTLYHYN